MRLEMFLQVNFNRSINPEEARLIADKIEMTMNGKTVEFVFGEQIFYIDLYDPSVVLFKLNSLYCSTNITIEDLRNITSIDECNIYNGKCEEANLVTAAIVQILFAASKPQCCAISVKDEVIKQYNCKGGGTANVIDAAFTSVWENATVTTPCKVNRQTKEVFDIELSPVEISGTCEREFITLGGIDFPVHGDHNLTNEENEYWYGAESAWFVRLDSWDRPVYKLSDGRYIKDTDPRPCVEPELCYSSNNEIDGEPDYPVKMTVKLLPKRVTWQ